MRTIRMMMVLGLVAAGCGSDGSTSEAESGPPYDVEGDSTTAPTTQPPRIVTDPDLGPVAVFTGAQGLTTDRVSDVVIGVDETVWAISEGEEDPRFESYTRFDGTGFADVGIPDLVLLDGGGAARGVYGMDVEAGPAGTLWLANTGFDSIGDIYYYDGDEWSSPVTQEAWLTTGAAAPDGSLWSISTANANYDGDDVAGIELVRVDGEDIDPQPLPEGGIRCVFCVEYGFDTEGILWMASEHGLYGFDGEAWTEITAQIPDADGFGRFPGEALWALGADDSHWYLTSNAEGEHVLTRYDGAEVVSSAIILTDPVIDRQCIADRFDIDDDTITDEEIADYDDKFGLAFQDFAGDADGNAWIALRCSGVYQIDVETGTVTRYGLEDGLPSLDLNGIVGHPDGSVWVATNAGLVRIAPTP